MEMKHSIYYKDTIWDLAKGEYISVRHQLAKFESYPMFDSQHARSEILRAVQTYKRR